MIVFKSVEMKNFFSVGDSPIRIDLCSDSFTLITGSNGAGKSSTILDSLTFGLFGRAYRNINKAQIVNSINEKKCLVTVEFSIGKTEYIINRGIKPNVFEIFENGKLLDQTASKDYQEHLEKNILKLNYNTFKQLVVLGSADFEPFMQLTAGRRRQVIEDILDIEIFSKMNEILKTKNAFQKTKKTELDAAIRTIDIQISNLKNNINVLKENTDEIKSNKIKEIEELENEIADIDQKEIDQKIKMSRLANDKVDEKKSELRSRKNNLLTKKSKIDYDNTELKTKITNISGLDKCFFCEEELNEDKKDHLCKSIQSQIEEINAALPDIANEIENINNELETLQKVSKKINDDDFVLGKKIQLLESNQKRIAYIQNDITKLNSSKSQQRIEEIQDDLKKNETTKDQLEAALASKMKTLDYYSFIIGLLKDTGIKAKVIEQYLPAINKSINLYLEKLDFFVSFHLDENFNETIKSRHRDDYSYKSFSQGEKQRIDLALLFTWREVAKMKNSINTNLLILDETFDSSLDAAGVENLMDILTTSNHNSNVFVISHKGEYIEDLITKKIFFEKKGNFTVMKKEI